MSGEKTPEEQLASNLRSLIEVLDPFEVMQITGANLKLLTRSKKRSHMADISFNLEPKDLGLRHLQQVISLLPYFLFGFRDLAEQRLVSDERDEKVRKVLVDVGNDSTSTEEALVAIRTLMSPEAEEG